MHHDQFSLSFPQVWAGTLLISLPSGYCFLNTKSLLISTEMGKNSGVLHRHSPLRQWFDSPCCWQQSMQWDNSTLQAVKWESRLLCGSFASRPQHCQERRDEGSGEERRGTLHTVAVLLGCRLRTICIWPHSNSAEIFYLLGCKNYNLKACFMHPMRHLTLETDVGHGVEQTRFLC